MPEKEESIRFDYTLETEAINLSILLIADCSKFYFEEYTQQEQVIHSILVNLSLMTYNTCRIALTSCTPYSSSVQASHFKCTVICSIRCLNSPVILYISYCIASIYVCMYVYWALFTWAFVSVHQCFQYFLLKTIAKIAALFLQ